MGVGACPAAKAVSRRNVHPAGDPTFRSEIHPPLLMATARVVTGSLVTGVTTGPEVTRVLLTSRPYLAGQHLVEQLGSIANSTPARRRKDSATRGRA